MSRKLSKKHSDGAQSVVLVYPMFSLKVIQLSNVFCPFFFFSFKLIADNGSDYWIDGKLLPKGASVIANTWDMHHNEKRYPNPDVFNPDNYTGYNMLASEYIATADYESRDHYAYGNGRRVCPGMHVGERNIFLGICKLLWAFKFEKVVDEFGNIVQTDIDPTTGYTEGFLITAKEFPCKITPRSEKRKETIMREFADLEKSVLSKYEVV